MLDDDFEPFFLRVIVFFDDQTADLGVIGPQNRVQTVQDALQDAVDITAHAIVLLPVPDDPQLKGALGKGHLVPKLQLHLLGGLLDQLLVAGHGVARLH